jgi:hypothetical protein
VRLWTVHPRYLDPKGLVALWREALLAQKVLRGETRGYRHHPQLTRFRESSNPEGAIAVYLRAVFQEAAHRGYAFDRGKIARRRFRGAIEETDGQLAYEWRHLQGKLQRRDPERRKACRALGLPEAHPLFRIVPGGVRAWEQAARRSRPPRSRTRREAAANVRLSQRRG